jgi:hypothetical protein
MSIRTTVSLDEDVLERVREVSKQRGTSFKETLNGLIREGLISAQSKPDRSAFRIVPSPVGLRPGLSYDDVEQLIEYGEGASHR